MGLSAYEISFPLLVFNRSRLSHGNERKPAKPTNLFALLQLKPATLSDAEPTTLFLLYPQTPNTKLSLGLDFFITVTQQLRSQQPSFPLSSGLETTTNKK